jgi:hypothetical protein
MSPSLSCGKIDCGERWIGARRNLDISVPGRSDFCSYARTTCVPLGEGPNRGNIIAKNEYFRWEAGLQEGICHIQSDP